MHFQCRSFIGKSSPFVWSQFWENEPDDRHLTSLRGHLFGLVILTSSDGGDLSTLGHELIDFINSAYYSHPGDSIPQILTEVISALNSKFSRDGHSITLILSVVCGSKLYSTGQGDASVSLVRANQIATLLNVDNPHLKTIAGTILDNDRIFVSTQNFINLLGWAKIKTSLSEDSLQSLEDNLLSLLYSTDNQADSAAILIEVHQDTSSSLSEPDIVPVDNPSFDPDSVYQPLPPPPPPIVIPTPKPVSKPRLISVIGKYLSKPSTISINPMPSPIHSRRKRINLLLSCLLLICLSASIYYGYQKRTLHDKQVRYDQLKSELDNKLDAALKVKTLNLKSAQALALDARSIVDQIIALKLPTASVDSYQKQINQLLAETGSPQTSGPQQFFDTSLIFKDAHYQRIFISGQQLYLLDTDNHQIDSLDLSQKSHRNISKDSQLSSANLITAADNKVYAVDSKSILLVKDNGLESKFDLAKISPSPSIKSIGSWNGAFYLLDTANLAIWKLTPNSTGFSSSSWLKDSLKVDPKTSSMALNGKLWLLTNQGKITPYLRGNPENFKQPEDITTDSAANLVTTADGELFAFSDKNIIYVYKKTGESKAQYHLGNLQIVDIAISADSSKIYALCSDGKIYVESIN